MRQQNKYTKTKNNKLNCNNYEYLDNISLNFSKKCITRVCNPLRVHVQTAEFSFNIVHYLKTVLNDSNLSAI
jgi:hypothetical protein